MNTSQSTVSSQQLAAFYVRRMALVICLLLTVGCLLLTVQAETPASREQRVRVFDDVWQTIEKRYYDAALNGVDWAAQRDKFRVLALNAANETEFYQILKMMIGTLRDSHTRVFAATEKFDWRNPRVISVGASVREIENRIVFTRVEKDSLAEKSGIKIGDALTSIADASATEILERRLREQPGASTAAVARLRAVAGVFEGAAGSFVRVGFQTAKNKKIRFAVLERQWQSLRASIKSRREGSTLIITFDAFTPEIVREFFEILQHESRAARYIILDLRANRGGSAEAMTDIASAFLPPSQSLGKFLERSGEIEIEAVTRRQLLYAASAARAPQTPVIILTSTATASAAEIFTAALKNSNRARTIGTTTCGCVLAVRGQHALPDGGALEISELDFKMPNGARLEGIGVAPDEKIILTHRDLLARRDAALERAFALIKNTDKLKD